MSAVEPPGSIPLLFTRTTGRLMSLDILRGLAVVLMILSGMLPKTLPNWVDHGYQPHYIPNAAGEWVSRLADFDNGHPLLERWKSFTWVDFVFPTFLFSMGAAIPIAMSRQRERGVGAASIVGGILGRWLVLIAFAVIIDNIVPPAASATATSQATNPEVIRLLTLASFGVVFLFFVRWPAGTPRAAQLSIRWIAGFVLIFRIAGYAVRRNDLGMVDSTQYFNWGRSDTIINVLAQTYLVSALAWMLTPRRPIVRLVLLTPLMLLAHYVAIDPKTYPDWLWMGGTIGSHTIDGNWPRGVALFTIHGQPWTTVDVLQSPKLLLNLPHWIAPLGKQAAARGWVKPAFNFAPLWDVTWYKYLFAVVPGTIIGDWLYRWSRRASVSDEIEPSRRDAWTSLALALLICVAVFVGLRNYGQPTLGIGGPLRTPGVTLVLTVPLLILFGFVTLPGARGDRWIERRLFKVGTAILVIGLLMACVPIGKASDGAYRYFEGGISKGPPNTLSYYASCVGLCCILLVGLIRAFDNRNAPRLLRLGPLAATGQNPLLAYYIGHAAFGPLFGLGIFTFLGHPFGANVGTLDDLFGGNLTAHPWLHALGDVAKTSVLLGFVWLLTKLRIFWRA